MCPKVRRYPELERCLRKTKIYWAWVFERSDKSGGDDFCILGVDEIFFLMVVGLEAY